MKDTAIEMAQKDIIDEFSMFEDWSDRYEYLISLGKELAPMPEQYKIDTNLIKGCQSRVWVYAFEDKGSITFLADSDALITKGIIALLVRVLSGRKPADIINADMSFMEKIGLQSHLSPTRANGLINMVKQLKLYALAYQTQLKHIER